LAPGILIIKPGQELRGRTGLPFRLRPVDLIWSLAVIAAGVRFDDARINGEASPTANDVTTVRIAARLSKATR
jgi:hypothetical protein